MHTWWSSKVWRQTPDLGSQTLTDPSKEQEMSLSPSLVQAKSLTYPKCPSKVCMGLLPFFTIQTLKVVSTEQVANTLSFGLLAT